MSVTLLECGVCGKPAKARCEHVVAFLERNLADPDFPVTTARDAERIAKLETENAALRRVARAARATDAYLRVAADPLLCDVCFDPTGGHHPDCPIPELHAALDALPDALTEMP